MSIQTPRTDTAGCEAAASAPRTAACPTTLGRVLSGPVCATAVTAVVAGLALAPALLSDYVLSPADVLLANAAFNQRGPQDEPANRLLTDVAFAFEPWLVEARRQLSAWQWPWLNPFAGFGAPLFGNFQSAVLSPFNWPFLVVGSPRTFAWQALAKVLCAALGAALLAQRLGLGATGQAFVSVCYALGGFMACWLLYPLTSVAAWFPWLCWSFLALADRRTTRRIGLAALVVALSWSGGHPETVMHVLSGAALFVLGAHPVREARRVVTAVVLAAAIGTATVCVQLTPFLDYLQVSSVWHRSESTRAHGIVQRLLSSGASSVCILLPFAYGSYARGDVHVEKALGLENFNEVASGYSGIVVPGLVVLVLAARQSVPRWVRAATALALAGWLVGYRWYPLFDLLERLPFVGHMQHQRLLLWAGLFGPLAAAYALEGVPRMGSRALRWVVVGYAAVAVAAVGTAWGVLSCRDALYARAQKHYTDAVRRGVLDPAIAGQRIERQGKRAAHVLAAHYSRSATLLALTAVALCAQASSRWARLRAFAFWSLLLLDLSAFPLSQWPVIPRHDWFPPLPLQQSRDPWQRTLFLRDLVPPNAATVYGVRDFRLYDGMEHQGLCRLVRALDPQADSPAAALSPVTLREHGWRHRLLAVVGVNRIVSYSGDLAGPCFAVERAVGRSTVWRIRCVEPAKAWLLTETLQASEATWKKLIEQMHPLRSVRISQPAPHLVHGWVETDAKGILVLPVLWLPGWRAQVNGKSISPRPVGGALVGIPVSAGRHEVRLRYMPPYFHAGLAISCISLVVVLGLFRYDSPF